MNIKLRTKLKFLTLLEFLLIFEPFWYIKKKKKKKSSLLTELNVVKKHKSAVGEKML